MPFKPGYAPSINGLFGLTQAILLFYLSASVGQMRAMRKLKTSELDHGDIYIYLVLKKDV